MSQGDYRKIALLLAGGLLSSVAQAQIDEDKQPPPAPPGESVLGNLVDLGEMTVEGERLEPIEELSLRLVDWALDVERSYKAEDAWKPVCWFDSPTGSHLTYLYCATNGDLNAIREESLGAVAAMGGGTPSVTDVADARIHRSKHPMTKLELERMLSEMGSQAINREVVIKTLKEGEIPKNLPYQAELDQFAKALADVRNVRARLDARLAGASEDEREALLREGDRAMAEAIVEAGLTVERYNEISSLLDEYVSLKAEVRERLAALDG